MKLAMPSATTVRRTVLDAAQATPTLLRQSTDSTLLYTLPTRHYNTIVSALSPNTITRQRCDTCGRHSPIHLFERHKSRRSIGSSTITTTPTPFKRTANCSRCRRSARYTKAARHGKLSAAWEVYGIIITTVCAGASVVLLVIGIAWVVTARQATTATTFYVPPTLECTEEERVGRWTKRAVGVQKHTGMIRKDDGKGEIVVHTEPVEKWVPVDILS